MNLDGKAPPLAEFLEDIPTRVAAFNCESMRFVMRKEYELACNWKVYVDNYLEGYHIPVVHPSLHKEIDYDSYRVEPHRYSSIQHAPLRSMPAGGGDDRKYDPSKTNVAEAVYGWLFPNIMLNVYMGQMQTNVVLPVSHDRTIVVFEWFATNPPADVASDPEWSRLVAFSDEIQNEDVEICETVQLKPSLKRVHDRGRYLCRARERRSSLPLAAARVPDLTGTALGPPAVRPGDSIELVMRRSFSLRSGTSPAVALGQLACVGVGTVILVLLWPHNHTREMVALFVCALTAGMLTLYGMRAASSGNAAR